jgi:hypothetical protein
MSILRVVDRRKKCGDEKVLLWLKKMDALAYGLSAVGANICRRALLRHAITTTNHQPLCGEALPDTLPKSSNDSDKSNLFDYNIPTTLLQRESPEVAFSHSLGPVLSSVYITTCPQLAKAALRAADERAGFDPGCVKTPSML